MYLRSQDWQNLRREDIVGGQLGSSLSESDLSGIAVLLGVLARGETTKGGPRQGVRPDREGVAYLLLKARDRTKPGEKVFRISGGKFRKLWNETAIKLGFDPGPAHALRHVGPSTDALGDPESGPYRTIDQIGNRGRWRAKTSVLRYMKTHALLAQIARVPPHIQKLGTKLLSDLGSRPKVAPA